MPDCNAPFRTAGRAATLAAAAFLTGGLFADFATGEPVSSAHDGFYAGRTHAVEAFSQPGCRDGHRVVVRIRNGSLHDFRDSQIAMKAIVTSDGFFTGSATIGNEERRSLEGLIDEDVLVGGVFGTRCSWLIKLEKTAGRPA